MDSGSKKVILFGQPPEEDMGKPFLYGWFALLYSRFSSGFTSTAIALFLGLSFLSAVLVKIFKSRAQHATRRVVYVLLVNTMVLLCAPAKGITATTTDLTSNNNPACPASGITSAAGFDPIVNLTLVQSLASPSPPAPGDYVTYTLTYENTGSTTATNVIITDNLPSTILFTIDALSIGTGVYNAAGPTVTWKIGNVAAGGSGSVTLKGYWGRLGGVYSNNATSYYISPGSSPPTAINNEANILSDQSPVVIATPVSASIGQNCGISFPNGANSFQQGVDKLIYYPMTIENTGNIYDNFSLSVPPFLISNDNKLFIRILDYNNISNELIPSETGWLPPNGTFTFIIELNGKNAPKPMNNDEFNLTITATSTVCPSSSTSTLTTSIINGGGPLSKQDVRVNKSASVGSYTIGTGPITYTIMLTNSGNTDASGVVLEDILPANLTPPNAADILPAPLTIIGNTITWPPITVKIDDLLVYTVKVFPTCFSFPSLINVARAPFIGDVNSTNNISTVTTKVISTQILPGVFASSAVVCADNTVTLTAANAIGAETYRWYTASTETIPFATGNNVTSTVLTSTTTFYVSIYDKDTQCESDRSPVTIVVKPSPQGSLTSNRPFCDTDAVELTWTATAGTGPYTVIYNDGTADRTQNNVTSGTAFNVIPTPVTLSTTYTLVSVTGANTCFRTSGFTGGSATITVNTAPLALALTGSSICVTPGGNGTITSGTSVTGISYQLYDAANAIVQAAQTGTGSGLTWSTLAAGNGYYVIGTNATTACVSPTSNLVNVAATPNPNINLSVGGTGVICWGAGTEITISGSEVGTIYQLRNDAGDVNIGSTVAGIGGPISLPTGNLIATTTFNVLATIVATSCSAELSETEVVSITQIPDAPTGTATQYFCSAVTPTVADLTPNGANIIWYDAATSGNSLANTTALTIGNDYFASQTINGCESADRFKVTSAWETVIPIFSPPTLNSSYCVAGIIKAVYNPGGDYKVNDLTPARCDNYILTLGNTLLDLSAISDNCTGTITISWTIDFGNNGSVDLGPTSGQISLVTPINFPVGDNLITWKVTDANGNYDTKIAILKVLPRPEINIGF